MGLFNNIGNFIQTKKRENENIEIERNIRRAEQEERNKARLMERISSQKAHVNAIHSRVRAEQELKALQQEERKQKYAKLNEGIGKVKTFLKEHKAKRTKPKGSIFTGASEVRPTGIFADNPTKVSGIAQSFGGTSPFVHQEKAKIIHKARPKEIHIHLHK